MKRLSRLTNYNDYVEFMDIVNSILNKEKIPYKWIDNRELTIYPINYMEDYSTAWHISIIDMKREDFENEDIYPVDIDILLNDENYQPLGNLTQVKGFEEFKSITNSLADNKYDISKLQKFDGFVDLRSDFEKRAKLKEETVQRNNAQKQYASELNDYEFNEVFGKVKDVMAIMKGYQFNSLEELYSFLNNQDDILNYQDDNIDSSLLKQSLLDFLVSNLNYNIEHAELKINSIDNDDMEELLEEINTQRLKVEVESDIPRNKIHSDITKSKIFLKLFDKKNNKNKSKIKKQ